MQNAHFKECLYFKKQTIHIFIAPLGLRNQQLKYSEMYTILCIHSSLSLSNRISSLLTKDY